MLAFMIDRKPRLAALCTLTCAILTTFGIIHSVLTTGEVYLPWAVVSHAHYTIALAYVLLSCILLVLVRKPKG